jgi:hypothetical protein
MNTLRRWLPWLLLAAQLAGCALSPERPEVAAASAVLAARQHQAAEQAAKTATGRRLWFAGFAMNSTSNAFQGDLELVSRVFSNLGGPTLRYEHSNELQTSRLRYPFAGPESVQESIKRIGSQTRAGDVVVLLLSSHGNRKILSVNAASTEFAPITASHLAHALAPLGDTPTVVLLSACYSGSFLPELARDTRIILTAASAERSSYGCDFRSRNTFFIEEMFEHHFDASMSLRQLAAQGHAQIAEREAAQKLTPSDPKLRIGRKVAWLADRPLKDWFLPF